MKDQLSNLSIHGSQGKLEISRDNLMNLISSVWFRPYSIRFHHFNSIPKKSADTKKSKRKIWDFNIYNLYIYRFFLY